MTDFDKDEGTTCKDAAEHVIPVGTDEICAAQCGLKKWCSAFTLTTLANYPGTKICRMYSTCEPNNRVKDTDLYTLKQRLDFHCVVKYFGKT